MHFLPIQTMRKQLLSKFRAEKEKMPSEKRTLVLTHFPRFLSLLEEEIYDSNSPIWDPEFRQAPPSHVQQQQLGGSSKSSDSDSLSMGLGSTSASRKRAAGDESGSGEKDFIQVNKFTNERSYFLFQGGKKQRQSSDTDDLDGTIAEVVAVIDEQTRMLGPQVIKDFLYRSRHLHFT